MGFTAKVEGEYRDEEPPSIVGKAGLKLISYESNGETVYGCLVHVGELHFAHGLEYCGMVRVDIILDSCDYNIYASSIISRSATMMTVKDNKVCGDIVIRMRRGKASGPTGEFLDNVELTEMANAVDIAKITKLLNSVSLEALLKKHLRKVVPKKPIAPHEDQ